jgi:cbb3-type cytochrome oxidase cytochrome c subunit
MNHGPLIFLGVFAALLTSWFGMIVQPQLQLGRATPGTNVVDTTQEYPKARAGLAQQGEQVYRSLGCAACHSQQVRQDGLTLNVLIREPGTNTTAVIEAMRALRPDLPLPEVGRLLEDLPAVFRSGLRDPERANADAKRLSEAGAKAQVQLVTEGPDIQRGWGRGRSVAADYLFDRPAMPGRLRLGPDLANVEARLPSAEWHYLHLFDPKSAVPKSVMPPYRFLFEARVIGRAPSPQALRLSPATAARLGEGVEVVPNDEAIALVAYLLSLRSDVPLLERPVAGGEETGNPPPPVSTNALPANSDTNPPAAG